MKSAALAYFVVVRFSDPLPMGSQAGNLSNFVVAGLWNSPLGEPLSLLALENVMN